MLKMSKKKIIIIGAGLSGLSAAFHLGGNYEIYEKESQPGGLCRSKELNGFIFDLGGHLLHLKKKYTRDLIKKFLGKNLRCLFRNSYVYSFGKFTRYPFQMNTFGLPDSIKRECVIEFIKARLQNSNTKILRTNFNQWIYHNFGSGIAKYFMIPYNEKFWIVHLKNLTCDWIDGFIPIPTISDVVSGALRNYPKLIGYNARFLYPSSGGIACLVKAFTRYVKKIHLNMELMRIYPKKKVIEFSDGRGCEYDKLILSVPLIELKDMIQEDMPKCIKEAFKGLKFNSIFNLNLGIKGKELSNKHWIYFPERDFVFFRVGFYSNFSDFMAKKDCYSIYAEVSYSNSTPVDKRIIVERIIEDLLRIGLITSRDNLIVKDIVDIKYGYIIYDRCYAEALRRITDYLKRNNIFMIGRYGRWKYMTMEDAILDGESIAKQLIL